MNRRLLLLLLDREGRVKFLPRAHVGFEPSERHHAVAAAAVPDLLQQTRDALLTHARSFQLLAQLLLVALLDGVHVLVQL